MIEIKVKQTYLDDAELEGSVIGQLQDAVAFVRNNSHRRWWKEDDYREDFFLNTKKSTQPNRFLFSCVL